MVFIIITLLTTGHFYHERILPMLDWLEKTWKTVYAFTCNTASTTFPLLHIILLVMAGCLGSMLYEKIKPSHRSPLLRLIGVIFLLMGASEVWDGFFVLQTGQFETAGTLLVAFSLLLGYVFGSAMDLERRLGRLGIRLYNRFVKAPAPQATEAAPTVPVKENNPPSAEGFILATLACAFSGSTLCYSVADESFEPAPLLVKLGFCFLTVFLLSAVYGANVTFAAVPTIAVEVILILVNQFWGHLLTATLMNQFMLIGGVILITAGLSLGLGKKLRAAHLIPALFIPVIYGLVLLLVDKFSEAE